MQSVSHPHAQRNAFRHRGVRQQSRSSAPACSTADTQPQLHPALLRLSAMISQYFTWIRRGRHFRSYGFHFGWRTPEFFGELGGTDMKAPGVASIWKPSGYGNSGTSFFRSRLIGEPRPARNQNKQSVVRVPSVIFSGVHFHDFPNLNRHKVFVVAAVKEFALTFTVKKSDDHMKVLVVVLANDSMTLVTVTVDWLAISCFHLLFSLPQGRPSAWNECYGDYAV